MRGSASRTLPSLRSSGSIPAYAGFSSRLPFHECNGGVHPRVCGVQASRAISSASDIGPSPRMRGSGASARVHVSRRRSIPAYAGFRRKILGVPMHVKVHPRVCGVQYETQSPSCHGKGPSPRMRGSAHSRRRPMSCLRSIPAYAGFSSFFLTPSPSLRVHPRVCGVQLTKFYSWGSAGGPSPRMRGSVRVVMRSPHALRSIPAQAGFRFIFGRSRFGSRVHPRASGVQRNFFHDLTNFKGPSPRKRGSGR